MHDDITFSATYPFPPEVTWRALSSSQAFAAWLMENTFVEPKVGHRFRFTDRPRPFWDGVCECEVVEAEAPRRLALKWGMDDKGGHTRVEWTLSPTPDGGTHLQFRHSGLKGFMGWVMKKGMTKGWQRMVERSIPHVAEAASAGSIPSRAEVKARLSETPRAPAPGR